jgi:hypothetical protein
VNGLDIKTKASGVRIPNAFVLLIQQFYWFIANRLPLTVYREPFTKKTLESANSRV